MPPLDKDISKFGSKARKDQTKAMETTRTLAFTATNTIVEEDGVLKLPRGHKGAPLAAIPKDTIESFDLREGMDVSYPVARGAIRWGSLNIQAE